METTGFWGSLHAIGTGCAAIVAYDTAHLLLSGAVSIVFFGALALTVMHVAHHRHKRSLLMSQAVRVGA